MQNQLYVHEIQDSQLVPMNLLLSCVQQLSDVHIIVMRFGWMIIAILQKPVYWVYAILGVCCNSSFAQKDISLMAIFNEIIKPSDSLNLASAILGSTMGSSKWFESLFFNLYGSSVYSNSNSKIIDWSGHTRLDTSRSFPNLAIKQSWATSVLG